MIESKNVIFVFRKRILLTPYYYLNESNWFFEKQLTSELFVREIRDVTIQNDRLRFRRNLERIVKQWPMKSARI